jgi:hypothetical protein
MTAKLAARPFQPGLSAHAERPKDVSARCGICRGKLRLYPSAPPLVEHQGQWFKRLDYYCPGCPFSGLISYYEAIGSDAAVSSTSIRSQNPHQSGP